MYYYYRADEESVISLPFANGMFCGACSGRGRPHWFCKYNGREHSEGTVQGIRLHECDT